MSLRQRRQAAIHSLLEAEVVPSQEVLAERLAARGIRATQATLSRDLREMGVVKGSDGYRLGQGGNGRRQTELQAILAANVLSADATPPLVVLKTPPGRAQIVGLELDRAGMKEIVGTVAGDDTIFIAAAGPAATTRLLRRLRTWAGLA